MKHPFKFVKSNIIFASIATVLIIFFKIRIYGVEAYTIGMSLGSILGILLSASFVAFLFWFILGRKENGGTTSFNIVIVLLVFGSFSEIGQMVNNRQKQIDDMQKAVSDYKESSINNPESIESNYSELSSVINNSIDDLISTSYGEERKVMLALRDYFKLADSTNIEWHKAYDEFLDPRILDFNSLNNSKEFEYQKQTIQEYINQSYQYKNFIEKRIDYIKFQTNRFDKSSSAYKGFLEGITRKDSIQKPILIPYITSHIEYGEGIKKIIEILETELGKWNYEKETETLMFENLEAQTIYEKTLNEAISNEEIVNELSIKLLETM